MVTYNQKLLIKKFEFPNLAEVVKQDDDIKNEDDVNSGTDSQFADENMMSEIGYKTQPIELYDPNIIKMTAQDLDDLLAKTRKEVSEEFKYKLQEANSRQSQIDKIVVDILTKIEFELQQLLPSITDLSYSIASKVVDVSLLNISHENVARIIQSRISDLNISNLTKIEVKHEEVADILRQNGIEVSINNDMLDSDYKIIWTNGFLEQKRLEITDEIEKTLTCQIRS